MIQTNWSTNCTDGNKSEIKLYNYKYYMIWTQYNAYSYILERKHVYYVS